LKLEPVDEWLEFSSNWASGIRSFSNASSGSTIHWQIIYSDLRCTALIFGFWFIATISWLSRKPLIRIEDMEEYNTTV
jgi:hypothetical protein